MTRRGELEDIDRLLIDGDNLLHTVRGGRDEGGVAWLLPQLADWRPSEVAILVALDGHPAIGETRRPRATRGVVFEHAGSRSADDVLIGHLESMPFSERARTVVVTADTGLSDRARTAGGRVRSASWLMDVVAAGAATSAGAGGPAASASIGAGRPPRRPQDERASAEREPWQAGRGATKKRGNPRRPPKRARRR